VSQVLMTVTWTTRHISPGTAVQVSDDQPGGGHDFLGYRTRSGQGRDQVPGFCCPD
jgi:hypothetical protein